MLLTKRFLSHPHSFKRRIGALYTLYGLYHKFPLGQNNFFFLRFELDEYKNLLELIQPFRSNPENPDPAFIFRKLELEGAILHCASACEPCYDFHNEEREFVELEYGKQRLAKSSAVTNALPKQHLKADNEILHHYHSMKIKLAGDEEDKPDKVLSMISPEFVPTISSTLGQLRQEILLELGMLENSSSTEMTEAEDQSSKNKNKGSKPFIEVEEMVEAVNKSSTATFSRHVMKQQEIVKSSDVRDFMAHPISKDILQPLRIQAKSEKEVRVPRRRGRPPKLKQKESPTEEVIPIPETQLNDGRVLLDVNSEPPTNQELKQALLPQPMPPKKKRGRKRVLALLKAATFPPRRPLLPQASTLTEEEDKSELSAALIQAPVALSTSATRLSASEFAHVPQQEEDPSTIVEVRLKAGDIRKTVRLKVKITLEAFKSMRKNGGRYANFKKKLKPLIIETQSGQDRLKEWIVESVDLPMEERNGEIAINTKKGKDKQQESLLKKGGSASPPKTISLRQKYECLKYAEEEDEELDDDQDEDDPPHKTSWKTEEEKDIDYNPPNEDPEEDALEFEDDNMMDEDEAWVTDEPTRFWRRRRGQRTGWIYSWEEHGPRDSDQLLKLRTEKSVSMVPVQVDGALRYFPMIKTQEKNAKPPLPSTDAFYTWNDFSSAKEPPFKKQRRSLNEPFPYIVTPQSLRNKRNPPMDRLRTFPPPRTKGIKLDLSNVSCDNSIDEEESSECSNQPIKKESEAVLKELADDWDEESYSAASASEVPPERNAPDDCELENDDPFESNCKVEQDVDDIFYALEQTKSEETIPTPTSIQELDPLFFHSPDAQVCLPSSIFGESHTQVEQFMPSDSEMLPITSAPSHSPSGSDERTTWSQPKDSMNLSDIPNSLSSPSPTLVPLTTQLNSAEKPVSPVTVSSLPSFTESSAALPTGSQLCPSTLYELEEENESKVLYYKVLTSDGNNLFIPASSFPQIEPQKIEILSFDVADVKPLAPVNDSPTAKSQALPHFPRPDDLHSVPPPPTPASPIAKSPAPPTVHRLSPRSDDTLRARKARCSFLFSSKLKPMMQHLPGASGEASGRPPSSERKVKFLFKGLLKSKRSL